MKKLLVVMMCAMFSMAAFAEESAKTTSLDHSAKSVSVRKAKKGYKKGKKAAKAEKAAPAAEPAAATPPPAAEQPAAH